MLSRSPGFVRTGDQTVHNVDFRTRAADRPPVRHPAMSLVLDTRQVIDLHILRTDPTGCESPRPDAVRIRTWWMPRCGSSAHRAALTDFERLRAEQKDLGRQVAAADADTRPALLVRTKELSGRVKQAEAHARGRGGLPPRRRATVEPGR